MFVEYMTLMNKKEAQSLFDASAKMKPSDKEKLYIAKENSDLVIVSCHWGYEDTNEIIPKQQEIATKLNEFGVDAVRYYSLAEMPFAQDGSITYEAFISRYNSELANTLGNLVNRTIAMINKYFGGKVEKPAQDYTPYDSELVNVLNETVKGYTYNFDNFRFQNGLNAVWTLISRCNKYIDETAPWVLAKSEDPEDKKRLAGVMYTLLEGLRIVSVQLEPFMPSTSVKILDQINTELRDFDSVNNFGGYVSGTKVNDAVVLFKRIDKE